MTPQMIASPGITLRLRRRFGRPPEALFRAWTDPDSLRRWWCPAGWIPADIEVDLRVGGAYRLGMRRVEGGDVVYVRGHFLEISAPEKLVYTWNWDNAFQRMPETRVTVKFIRVAGVTELELTHAQLPEVPVCLLHRAGWVEAWQRLEKILSCHESGVP